MLPLFTEALLYPTQLYDIINKINAWPDRNWLIPCIKIYMIVFEGILSLNIQRKMVIILFL
jgi:hypothetical protein